VREDNLYDKLTGRELTRSLVLLIEKHANECWVERGRYAGELLESTVCCAKSFQATEKFVKKGIFVVFAPLDLHDAMK
jgi:hypothetical protein